MIRLAEYDTDWTGNSLECPAAEGVVRAERHPGAGVVLMLGGKQASIETKNLADLGRFFLAAAKLNGEDV